MSLDFRLFGIRVRMQVWFVLFGMLLGMSHPSVEEHPWFLAVFLGIVFLGVLSHELGHAVVGRLFGWTPRIDLVALGGVTSFEGIERGKPWQRMAMVASGPFVNGVLGAVCFVAHAKLGHALPPLAALALEQAGIIQIFWAVLNLIPMLPLDGGHLLLEGLRWIAPEKGPRIAGVLMMCVVTVLLAYGVHSADRDDGSGGIVLIAIALFSGFAAFRLVRDGTLRPEDGRSLREQAYFALARRDGPLLAGIAGKLVAAAESPESLDEAFHLLAWGRLFAGQPREAKKALSSLSRAHPATHALEGAIALELGDPDGALVEFEKILPKLNPWLEDYIVRAILLSRRWEEARVLFEDDLGREFSTPSVLAVMTAARADGATDAADGMRALLARRVPA